MARISASTPATYATTITFPRVYNLQYPGDALTVTATKSGGGTPGATTWEVRDLSGTVIATGAWSGTSTTIGTAGSGSFSNYGWYRLTLKGTTAGDGAFTTDYGACTFVIAEDRDPHIPRAPLRASNPSNLASGLDAPLAHGLFSLGGARLGLLAQNIQTNRQQASQTASAATSCSVTLPGDSTTNSDLTLIHAIVGDDTGAAGPGVGWTLDGTGTHGSGSTKISVRIYRAYGSFAGGTSFSVTSTNAANHSLYLTEIGPYITAGAPLSIQFFTGVGTSVAITKDMTSLAPGTTEYEVVTGFAANAGTFTSETSTPAVSPVFGSGNILAGTQDSFGGGINHSITYNISTSADYVGFFVALKGDPGAFNTYTAANAKAQIDAWWSSWGQYEDPARPYRQLTVATLGGTNANAVTDYAAAIAQIVSDTHGYQLRTGGSSFIGCYSGRNEPQGQYSLAEAAAFRSAVHNGDATAKAGGPGYVTMGLGVTALPEYLTFVDGGLFDGSHLDVDLFHAYNMCNGDVALTLYVYRAFAAGRASRGISSLPIFMAEGAHDTNWYPGVLLIRQAGTAHMLEVIAREAILRMPYEHDYYYYDRRGGFDSVTTWASTDGGPYPGWAMHRAYACELYGKTLDHVIDFGWLDILAVGGVWRNGSDDTSVLAVVGTPGVPAVTFYVSGTTVPGTLVSVDCFGNTGTVTLTGNTFTLTPTDAVQYVRFPAGLNVAARPVHRGVSMLNFASLSYADDGDGSATRTNLAHMADTTSGYLLNPYAYGSADMSVGSLYSTGTTTFPRNITITTNFGETVKADTVAAYCPAIWQNMGAILKGKLQYTTDGSTWLDAGSWDNTATVTVKNYDLYSDTMADCYTDPQHYFEYSLGSVKALLGVRVVATTATTGGMYVDSMMYQPTGSANAGDTPAAIQIVQVMALCATANGLHPAMT